MAIIYVLPAGVNSQADRVIANGMILRKNKPINIEHTYFDRNAAGADPKVLIIDETGQPLQDKYYEVDSTMQLSCIVRHVAMRTSTVLWSHGDQVLNYDTQRGGLR